MVSILKHALIDFPEPAWRLARKVDISETRLSRISRGAIEPRLDEKIRLAKILDKQVDELFPESQSQVTA